MSKLENSQHADLDTAGRIGSKELKSLLLINYLFFLYIHEI